MTFVVMATAPMERLSRLYLLGEQDRIAEIKSPLILQPGPAALTDGLDAIVAALGPKKDS
jgi:hypothetical protein